MNYRRDGGNVDPAIQNVQRHSVVKSVKAFGIAIALSFGLVACQTGNLGLGSGELKTNELPTEIQLSPNPKGEVSGQGNVRVSLLIPKTAPGNGATVANEIRNGALLAMRDFGQNSIQLVIKDTKGQAASAQEMASEAISEGSSAIIGPLFSSSVSAASGVTAPAGRTVIAFSTDTSVARRGVYLLSYTPQADTRRMITYALSQGKRSIHAFLPISAQGNLQEAELRQIAGQAGANVQVTRYERTGPGIEEAVTEAVVTVANADSIYIPEGGQIPEAILNSLNRLGLDTSSMQIMGSGQWESVKFNNRYLNGAIYTGRDISKFNSFSTKFQTAYETPPSSFAALGYDAITLISSLLQNRGKEQAFSPTVLEDRRGFAGINGIFRLRSDGTAERGLAIYRVANDAGTLESPAPTSFSRK